MKWVNYAEEWNTWEPIENLEGSHELVEDFNKREREKEEKKDRQKAEAIAKKKADKERREAERTRKEAEKKEREEKKAKLEKAKSSYRGCYETLWFLDQNDKPIELSQSSCAFHWKMKYIKANRQYRESQRVPDACVNENRILKSQVENLKELLKELPSLRRDNKVLTDQSTKHEAEIELLKSELNRCKQENNKLMTDNRTLKTILNPQQRNLNGVYKSRRILEKKNENLQKELKDIKEDFNSLGVKSLKNTRILGL